MTRFRSMRNLILGALASTTVLTSTGCSVDDRSRTDAEAGRVAEDSIVRDPAVAAIDAAYRRRVEEMKRTFPIGLDVCDVAPDVDRAIDTIRRWPRPLMQGDDGCVLAMIDSLSERFVRTGDDRYLEALDSLGMYSDGYVGEALSEHANAMAARRTDRFFAYVLDERRAQPPVAWQFASWNQVEFEDRPASPKRAQLTSAINDSLADLPLTGAQRARLDSILREAKLID